MRYLIIILTLFSLSCASSKKQKLTTSNTINQIVETKLNQENKDTVSTKVANFKELLDTSTTTIIEESITSTIEIYDSTSNKSKSIPVTKSKKYTFIKNDIKKIQLTDSISQKQTVSNSNLILKDSSNTSSNLEILDKETEETKIVKNIFSSLVQFLICILLILSVGLYIFKKVNQFKI